MTQNKTYNGECVISQRRTPEISLRWRRTTSFQKKWKIFQGECPSWFLKNKQNLYRQSSVLYCAMLSHSVVSNSSQPHGLYPTRLSVHGISQARILEWVSISFSSGFSWLGNWTEVSCIAGGFFTIWATREAQTVWVKEYSLSPQIFVECGFFFFS